MRETTFDDLTLDEIIKTLENLLKTKESNHIFINYCKEKYNIKEKDCVIFYHGFKGFKDWGHFNQISERFANSGLLAVKFNGSYNGLEDNHDANEILFNSCVIISVALCIRLQ